MAQGLTQSVVSYLGSPVRPFSNNYGGADQVVLPACALNTRGTRLGSTPESAQAQAHCAHPSKGAPIVEGARGGHCHGVGEGIPGWGGPGRW